MRQDREHGFTRRALETPDGQTTQPDPDRMRVARQAPSAATSRLVCELNADGQGEGEHPCDKGSAIAEPLNVGRFMLKIDRDGPMCARLAGCVSHGAPSRSEGRGS